MFTLSSASDVMHLNGCCGGLQAQDGCKQTKAEGGELTLLLGHMLKSDLLQQGSPTPVLHVLDVSQFQRT